MKTQLVQSFLQPVKKNLKPSDGKYWDIFCKVVDNYGDIGICWRLARCLANHGLNVRLWVDDIKAFHRIYPNDCFKSLSGSVRVQKWCEPFPDTSKVADVIIEAFACELPGIYLSAMAQRQPAPAWINLEYLSAEDWVEGCHGLPSPHPSLPLVKHFFFPGFTSGTGGLLREKPSSGVCKPFFALPDERNSFLASLGVPASVMQSLIFSIYAYEQQQLPILLKLWSEMARPVLVLVAEGGISAEIARFFNKQQILPGDIMIFRMLTVVVLPFMAQEAYDRMLCCCDINFVRGEDSFVQAQWTGFPFVWQIYAQQDQVHLAKLEAFMVLFCDGLEGRAAKAMRRFWQAWNGVGELSECWEEYLDYLPTLTAHSRDWTEKLLGQDDLATNLVKFSISGL